MEELIDSLQSPARTDDSELGYAPRYRHSIGLNDADEPLAYNHRYNSVYEDNVPKAQPSNGTIVPPLTDRPSANAVADSVNGPSASLPGGSESSDDEVSLKRVAAYTRSASLSTRTAAAAAAAAAARTAALSQHLGSGLSAESVEQALQLLDISIEPQVTIGADSGTPDASMTPIAAADPAPRFSTADNPHHKGEAGKDAAFLNVEAQQKLPTQQAAVEGLPQAYPMPNAHPPQHDAGSQMEDAELAATSSLGFGHMAAVCRSPLAAELAQGTQSHSEDQSLDAPQGADFYCTASSVGAEYLAQHRATGTAARTPPLTVALEGLDLYLPNPPDPEAGLAATNLALPPVLDSQWVPADAGTGVAALPATWHEADARSFEDVPLDLAPALAGVGSAAPVPRPSATGPVIGTVKLPLDAADVVATMEHPVFDDPDVVSGALALGAPGASEVAATGGNSHAVAAALSSTGSASVQQLLADYRIAAAAGLVSPELASLLGLAPPPAESGAADGQGQGLPSEEAEDEVVVGAVVPLGAAQAEDAAMKDPRPCGREISGMALAPQAQQIQEPAPLAHVTDFRQIMPEVSTGGGGATGAAAVPAVMLTGLQAASTPAAPAEIAASGQLSSAAHILRPAVGDPFDAADTEDDDGSVNRSVEPNKALSTILAAGAAPPPPYLLAQPAVGASLGPAVLAVGGLAVAAGAAAGAVAMAGQQATAATATAVGTQQHTQPESCRGPAAAGPDGTAFAAASGRTGPAMHGAAQLPTSMQLTFPPPPYAAPRGPDGTGSDPGQLLPTSMRPSTTPLTALEPRPGSPQQHPQQRPPLQPGNPPAPLGGRAPGFGFSPQGSRGPAGAPAPNGVPVPGPGALGGSMPSQAHPGGGLWPRGRPAPGPHGPGPMPPRPELQPLQQPQQPHAGAVAAGPCPTMPGSPGHGPVQGGSWRPTGPPPGIAVGPGVRPPGAPAGRGSMMPGPGAGGPPGASRSQMAPGAGALRPPLPLPPHPSPYPGLLYTEGRDTLGRPVVVLNTAMLPAKVKKNDVLQYLLQQLHPLVQRDYVIVVLSLGLGVKAGPVSSTWALGAYRSLTKPFRKNVKHIVLVQPSAWARAMLALAQPFVSKKASHKVKKVDNLVEITEATAGEVKLESLGARFIREIQYGLGAPPLAGMAPPGGLLGPQQPRMSQGLQPPRGPPMTGPPGAPPMQPPPPYPGPPVSYGPPGPRPMPMPPGSAVTTPVYGPGGPGPMMAGRIQGPPPPRPQFLPGPAGPGGRDGGGGVERGVMGDMAVGPQPAGDGGHAPVQPPVSR